MLKSMATISIAQTSEDSSKPLVVDIKVPSSVEVQIDEWPRKVTDVLSPDLVTGETDSVIRQLGYEADEHNAVTEPTPVVNQNSRQETCPTATTEDDKGNTSESSISTSPNNSLPSTPELDFIGASAVSNPVKDYILSDRPSERLALQILDIIQRYGHSTTNGNGASWAGKTNFLPLVEQSIQKGEPVKMVLPAFPCVGSSLAYLPYPSHGKFTSTYTPYQALQ